ncbi:hypothetical protein BDQ17DRAFT_1254999 [Cyathus striatus]|nr:hypothetical protein BDQ17DRAFT_1254999 [Cyathus striatus]
MAAEAAAAAAATETGQTRGPPSPTPSIRTAEPPAKRLRVQEQAGGAREQRKAKRGAVPEPCSPEDVVWKDVVAVLGEDVVSQVVAEGKETDVPDVIKGEGWGMAEKDQLELSIVECVVRELGSGGSFLSFLPCDVGLWWVQERELRFWCRTQSLRGRL